MYPYRTAAQGLGDLNNLRVETVKDDGKMLVGLTTIEAPGSTNKELPAVNVTGALPLEEISSSPLVTRK